MRESISRMEAAAAGLLTAAAVALHLIAFRFAGGLWRDEANTVALSSLPSLRDVWGNLEYDSFPMAWVLIVRLVARFAGVLNDHAFRAVGLIIGVAIIGALWFLARSLGHRFPIVSLALFALCPSVIHWGDSLRAYGLGMALALTLCAVVWRYVEHPTGSRFALAAIVAVLSVQVLYYNAASVFAVCIAGGLVALVQGRRPRAIGVLVVGLVAAASLIPYVSPITRASTWNSVVRIPDYDLSWFMLKLMQTIGTAGVWAIAVWVGAFIAAVYGGLRMSVWNKAGSNDEVSRDKALYGVAILIVGSVAMFAFLRTLAYLTQPWYYLTLVTLLAAAFEILSGALILTIPARRLRLVLFVSIGIATLAPAARLARTRMTNIDTLAAAISRAAQPDDLIIVRPWYQGVTFDRYYRGQAPWMTIPILPFHAFHRYDLVQLEMQKPDQREPAQSVIRMADRVLQEGGTVFIVGSFGGIEKQAVVLPPARIPEDGWKSDDYERMWATMLIRHMQQHAVSTTLSKADTTIAISDYETAFVFSASGWKQPRVPSARN